MAKGVRVSLANKCQLLFGAAVVLILTAALAVVWLRMQKLVDRVPQERAEDIAEAWLTDPPSAGAPLLPPEGFTRELGPEEEVAVAAIDAEAFEQIPAGDTFLRQAVERFRLRPEINEAFTTAEGPAGEAFYRYARAVRQSDLIRDDAEEDGSAAGLPDPLKRVLLFHLRDPEAATQEAINRIYILAAGIFAGLLAIGVFWFITTRIILSPVRVLREYAAKVSGGDLNIRSDINTGDEYEELSDMFNTMLENLKHNQDQLRQINKSLDLKLGELAESNVSLYEANKMKGEFLANVSHELRTPLNSIIGFAEVLQETLAGGPGAPGDEKRKRYASHIITSSRRLLDLINDLLDLAKIEAGRMDLHVAPVSLSDTTEGLLALMKPQAEKRGVTLRQKVEPGLPIVQTDAGKLQQVLFNFLSNAVKFTPEGGTVTLAAAVGLDTGDHERRVRLSVSDTGPGIPPEDQERVFDKFTQLDPGVTKQHGGTGLGLTISRELAQMLQGRIEVESDPGRGATFSLVIPTELQQRSVPLMPDLASGPRA